MSNLFICFNFFFHKSVLIDVDNSFQLVQFPLHLKDNVEAGQIKERFFCVSRLLRAIKKDKVGGKDSLNKLL